MNTPCSIRITKVVLLASFPEAPVLELLSTDRILHSSGIEAGEKQSKRFLGILVRVYLEEMTATKTKQSSELGYQNMCLGLCDQFDIEVKHLAPFPLLFVGLFPAFLREAETKRSCFRKGIAV